MKHQRKTTLSTYFAYEKKRFIKNKNLFAMCSIPALKIIIFSYLPMVGIILAFKDFKPAAGIFGSEWVGLTNFEFFFKSNDAWRILRNTVLINFINIFGGLIVNVLVALLLYEITNKLMLKFYQTMLFVPYFFSFVLVGLMLTPFFSSSGGILTNLITYITGNKVNIYAEPAMWVVILPLVSIWKGVGYGSLMYYSSLMSLDSTLFEAATIDGANKFQKIRYISIPALLPMICVLTIISVGNVIKSDFGLFYYVTRDSAQLYQWTDTIDTYVFRALTTGGNFSITSAISLFQNVVGMLLVIITNKIVNRVDSDYSLF